MASSMAKAGGRKAKENRSQCMKESTLMIRRRALESFDGLQEMYMKETSKLMKEMATER